VSMLRRFLVAVAAAAAGVRRLTMKGQVAEAEAEVLSLGLCLMLIVSQQKLL